MTRLRTAVIEASIRLREHGQHEAANELDRAFVDFERATVLVPLVGRAS